MSDDIVVMLSALELEYSAVLDTLSGVEACYERGTRFEMGRLPGSDCRVVLGMTSKGNNPAAVLAERAMQRFDPAAVLFVGVAGALRDKVRLGDVVMATHVYAYHGGTSDDDGLRARPRVWETEHGLGQIAGHVSRACEWRPPVEDGERSPEVHFGVIAAGEVVLNSRTSHEAETLHNHYNDALAIEMESAGVAQAGHHNGVPVGIVRGVSDRADGTKNAATDENSQPRAAANAAAFATRLATELINEQEHTGMGKHRNDQHGTVVTNTNSGTVGIQAANIHNSSVHIGHTTDNSTTPDLTTGLTNFRTLLEREHAAGALDEPTYKDAQQQLDIAHEALDNDTTSEGNTILVALKRLRGLTADVASLATAVASLITAANGLS